jgi:hypothetical protein
MPKTSMPPSRPLPLKYLRVSMGKGATGIAPLPFSPKTEEFLVAQRTPQDSDRVRKASEAIQAFRRRRALLTATA